MARNLGPCILCPGDSPRPARQNHHERPLEYGGPEDGKTAALCASCHDELHRVCEAVWSSKLGLDQVTRPALRRLVLAYMRQRTAFAQGKADGVDEGLLAADARRRISISLSASELRDLHLVKIDMGEKSLDALLLKLVRAMIAKHKSGKI